MQSQRVRKLREILETSEAPRQCIIYLSIDPRAADPLIIDDGDVEWKFHDENLSPVINMLAEIRHLNIRCANDNAIEWDRLSEGIKTALWNTRFTSPHLSFLSLTGISMSPHDLVDRWKSINKIALRSVETNGMGNDTS
jgi:hypothetical protein